MENAVASWAGSALSTDGFGRTITAKAYETATSAIQTMQAYDPLGHVLTMTNPSRPGDGLGFATTYAYESLGRPTSVTTADGSLTQTCYSGAPGCSSPSANATGSWVVVKDQAGAQRQIWSDGLGRMTQVIEDPRSSPHLNYVSSYTYDSLGDLTGVNQSGRVRQLCALLYV